MGGALDAIVIWLRDMCFPKYAIPSEVPSINHTLNLCASPPFRYATDDDTPDDPQSPLEVVHAVSTSPSSSVPVAVPWEVCDCSDDEREDPDSDLLSLERDAAESGGP